MGEKKPEYYVTVTYGPYTRGQAQNKVWDIDREERDEQGPPVVTIKHAAD